MTAVTVQACHRRIPGYAGNIAQQSFNCRVQPPLL
ncbi:hypothetical protein SAMN05444172_8648 [Burkholderia sp. GAS332]|nr:hypothetical protein SAMN05444172_8648 [Burkholderia sp. GAS332]